MSAIGATMRSNALAGRGRLESLGAIGINRWFRLKEQNPCT